MGRCSCQQFGFRLHVGDVGDCGGEHFDSREKTYANILLLGQNICQCFCGSYVCGGVGRCKKGGGYSQHFDS